MSHWHHYLGMAAGVGLVAAVIATTHEAPAVAQTIEGVEAQVFDPRELSCGNQPCDAVVRGALTFVRRNFRNSAATDVHAPTAICPRRTSSSHQRLPAPGSNG